MDEGVLEAIEISVEEGNMDAAYALAPSINRGKASNKYLKQNIYSLLSTLV